MPERCLKAKAWAGVLCAPRGQGGCQTCSWLHSGGQHFARRWAIAHSAFDDVCPLRQVHEATLIDLVYPTEIVGKRVRYRLDGSKLLKARGALPEG